MNLAIEKLTADLNIIQKLDDEPNDVGGLSAAELKARFDEAGRLIQDYLNQTLVPQIKGENIPIKPPLLSQASHVQAALDELWNLLQSGGFSGLDGRSILFSDSLPADQPTGGLWIRPDDAGAPRRATFFVKTPAGYTELRFPSTAAQIELDGASLADRLTDPTYRSRMALFPYTLPGFLTGGFPMLMDDDLLIFPDGALNMGQLSVMNLRTGLLATSAALPGTGPALFARAGGVCYAARGLGAAGSADYQYGVYRWDGAAGGAWTLLSARPMPGVRFEPCGLHSVRGDDARLLLLVRDASLCGHVWSYNVTANTWTPPGGAQNAHYFPASQFSVGISDGVSLSDRSDIHTGTQKAPLTARAVLGFTRVAGRPFMVTRTGLVTYVTPVARLSDGRSDIERPLFCPDNPCLLGRFGISLAPNGDAVGPTRLFVTETAQPYFDYCFGEE